MHKRILFNLLVIVSLLLAACASSTPPAPAEAPAEAAPTEAAPAEAPAAEAPAEVAAGAFTESAMLTELVKAGSLPPLDERLPAKPMVIAPLVEQGQYSPEMKFGFVGNNAGAAAWGGMLYMMGWEHLVTWKPDFNSIEPNIAESIDVSDDATEYTFHLRQGMKWSDGQPFTADDIMFYIDDVLRNEELFPNGFGADWLPGDMTKELKVDKLDDYTVKFTFPKPYGTFLYQLATWAGRQFVQYPKHYLMQFHKKYNEKVDELVTADGSAKDWVGLFVKKAPDLWGDPSRFFDNPDLPSVYAWVIKEPIGTGTQLVVERNPYYWKVDTQGNQLPYIDRVIGVAFQDDSSRTFAMLNGDLDYIKDPGDPNRELYFGAVDEGKPIKILNVLSDGGNTQSIHFNRTFSDTIKSEIFANKDFRIGMSYAINRPELIEVVFKGQGTPAQVGPLDSSPIYNEQLATQYTDYDVAKANEYLDKVLPNKDAEGFRLDKNGDRLTIIFSVINDLSFGTHWVQVAELLVGYWKAVGVEVQLNSVTDAVFGELRLANNFEMSMFHGGEGGAGLTAILDPRWHVPGEFWGLFGNGWSLCREFIEKQICNEDNEYGQPWPEEIFKVREMYSEAIQQPTQEGQIAKMKEIMQASADNFWIIGVSRPAQGYDVMQQKMMGIPDNYWGGWLEGVSKINRPEQWWISQ
jgi:peptide/nickel transport system substrate-binding protein